MQATREFLEPEEQDRQRKKFEDELEREARPVEFDPMAAFQKTIEKQERRAREAAARSRFSATKL